MKIHRLLSIIIYLLNRDTVSARQLAEKFEVSKRTIQRDIEAINLAGIPVVSFQGSKGGYGLSNEYRIDRRLASVEDYNFIITALKGLFTAFNSREIDETLEKMISLSPNKSADNQTMFLDFSVLGESPDINEKIRLAEGAVKEKKIIEFDYTDVKNRKTHRKVEPLALRYRWYSWYLFGYCRTRNDYRLFKLPRITDLHATGMDFSGDHGNIEQLMIEQELNDDRRYLDVRLLCKSEIRVAALEYLFGRIVTEFDNGDFILAFQVPEYERMWIPVLMGFGDKVTVLDPPEVKEKLIKTANEILRIYS
ncbi:MAG: YafY family transcriptional regulator [Dehalococcoidales bacterium]|nr:YafY family transcriptional regulator [Dehalococcoidales bacterium]